MSDYDKEVKKNEKRNEKFLEEFENYLREKNLSSKTISNHLSNVDFYLNNYLVYYDVIKMEDGVSELGGFLGDWFIRKCMWSTESTVRSTAASIKKFYQCMLELNHINEGDYKFLADTIKEDLPNWVKSVNKYNSFDEDDFEEEDIWI